MRKNTQITYLHIPVFRTYATPNKEMVNVFEEKSSTGKRRTRRHGVGMAVTTSLFIKAWVRNVAYIKNVWIDIHVFDGMDKLKQAETMKLDYLGPAGANGDFFVFDKTIYRGTVATPGSCSPKPDTKKIQYRLYYEVNNHVFTDGYFLHQHELF